MEGFKSNPKMKSDIACYKEGGSVYKSRMHKEDPQELAEDKAMVKKGIRQHEAAQHKGEPKTDIKLKAGRRVKKTGGVVNKFKTGGVVNKFKTGGVTNADDKGGKEDPIKKVKDTSGKANAPSATVGKKKDPTTNFKRGRWVNEEPDDATAVPTKKAAPKPKKAPIKTERQTVMDMFQDGPGTAETPSAPMALPQDGVQDAFAFGGSVADMVPQAGVAGLGNALDTGALGGAGPMGASRNVPMTPQEQDVLRGLQAVGSYCRGGKV